MLYIPKYLFSIIIYVFTLVGFLVYSNNTHEQYILNSDKTFINHITCKERDSLALVALYNSAGGKNWRKKWNLNKPVRTWFGVSISQRGCVVCLDLDGIVDCIPSEGGGNNLVGTIPKEIGNLSRLAFLGLSYNKLTGPIPPEIGNLNNLVRLQLSDNNFTGSIPKELTNLTSLKTFHLQFNSLSGQIPEEIGSLPSLVSLSLANNQLVGHIPNNIGALENLQYLYLWGNELTDSIPESIGKLTQLKVLDLVDNKLVGNIPASIGELKQLEQIVVLDNNLTGPIPSQIGNLDSLKILALGRNSFTGNIPKEIGNLTNLEILHLGRNLLIGEFPKQIGNLDKLKILYLHGNQLSGELPFEMGDLVSLEEIYIDGNKFSGYIPRSIKNLKELRILQLGSNCLSGPIPKEISELVNLTHLYLFYNDLSGCFPSSLNVFCRLGLSTNQRSGYNFLYNPDLVWEGDFTRVCRREEQPKVINHIKDTICIGQELSINGKIYNENNPTGSEIIVEGAFNNCDSLIEIQLTFVQPTVVEITDVICENTTYEVGSVQFTTSGEYEVYVDGGNVNGCDSIIILHLTQEESTFSNSKVEICEGSIVNFNGTNINHAGIFNDTLSNSMGCDSIVSLEVTVKQLSFSEQEISLCQDESYIIQGQELRKEGEYEFNLEGRAMNGCDSIIRVLLNFKEYKSDYIAEIVDEVHSCTSSTIIEGNLPANSTGHWRSLLLGVNINIEEPANTLTKISNLQSEETKLTWNVESPICSYRSSDTLTIYLHDIPQANDDYFKARLSNNVNFFDIFENDNLANRNDYTATISNIPDGVTAFLNSNKLEVTIDKTFQLDTLYLAYNLCSHVCLDSCTTAKVVIKNEKVLFPNTITPNNDGQNDYFVIDALFNNAYPKNEMIIFNRWGDIVFKQTPYLNQWNGIDQKGNELSQGTYYYILRLDINSGLIYRGEIVVIK